MTLMVKVRGEPFAALPAVQNDVQALDPDLPVFGANTLDAATSVSLLPVQIAAFLALAPPATVVWLVTRQGLRWTSTGIILGLAASLAVTRLLTGWLYGVGAIDPVVFLSAPLLLAGTAYAACALPGRWASSVDPVVALRVE